MHPQLKAVFDEHRNPTHASKRAVHDLLAPIFAATKAVQQQMLEYKHLLAQAEIADHDHIVDGTMEHIRQTFSASEREANAIVEHGRNLAHAFVQLESYMAEQEAKLAQPQPNHDAAPEHAT